MWLNRQHRDRSWHSFSIPFFGEDVTRLSFNPVKTLESVFKPIFNPLFFKVLKPFREAKKLPGILVKKFQALVGSLVSTKETSLKNYVSIGAYYVSKRLLVLVALVLLFLAYFIFIRPPALVSKWFNKVPVVVENSTKAAAFTGDAKIISADKKQSRYVGGLADGLYMGTGKLYNEAGTLVYEGEFDKGLKSGAGTLYDDSGKLVYKGQFVADQFNGEGTLFQNDRKIRYIGQFQNGKFGGTGKLYNENGALLYEGAFLEGMYHGAGTLFGQNGQIVYEGEFAANTYNGTGKLYEEQGKLRYEGAFKAGHFAGEGTEFGPNGFVKYKGGFVAGSYSGAGELHDDKGVLRFKGSFQNRVLTGPGEAYDETGKLLYKGDFADGLYDGFGTLYEKDGGIALKSFFEQGRISLQTFIGFPSKKLEDLLGKPAEVTLLDQVQPLAEGSADNAGTSPSASVGAPAGNAAAGAAGSGGAAGNGAAGSGGATARGTGSVTAADNAPSASNNADNSGSFGNAPGSAATAGSVSSNAASLSNRADNAGMTTINAPGSAASIGIASSNTASTSGTSGSAASTSGASGNTSGMKFQMIYSDLQYTFLVEPSKTNPKEAVVTELTVWGSKPLSLLQPAIETFKEGERTNTEGFAVLELGAPFPGGLTINRYYRDDNLYSLTLLEGEKVAHELEIIKIERIKP